MNGSSRCDPLGRQARLALLRRPRPPRARRPAPSALRHRAAMAARADHHRRLEDAPVGLDAHPVGLARHRRHPDAPAHVRAGGGRALEQVVIELAADDAVAGGPPPARLVARARELEHALVEAAGWSAGTCRDRPRGRRAPRASPSPRRSSRAGTPRRRARAGAAPPGPAATPRCFRPARLRPRWRRSPITRLHSEQEDRQLLQRRHLRISRPRSPRPWRRTGRPPGRSGSATYASAKLYGDGSRISERNVSGLLMTAIALGPVRAEAHLLAVPEPEGERGGQAAEHPPQDRGGPGGSRGGSQEGQHHPADGLHDVGVLERTPGLSFEDDLAAVDSVQPVGDPGGGHADWTRRSAARCP